MPSDDDRPSKRLVPPDVPEGILREIGRVVACGAWLETWLAALAGSLRNVELDTQENRFGSYAAQPVSKVVQAIEERAHLANSAEPRILTLVETVRPLIADRNKMSGNRLRSVVT